MSKNKSKVSSYGFDEIKTEFENIARKIDGESKYSYIPVLSNSIVLTDSSLFGKEMLNVSYPRPVSKTNDQSDNELTEEDVSDDDDTIEEEEEEDPVSKDNQKDDNILDTSIPTLSENLLNKPSLGKQKPLLSPSKKPPLKNRYKFTKENIVIGVSKENESEYCSEFAGEEDFRLSQLDNDSDFSDNMNEIDKSIGTIEMIVQELDNTELY